MVKFITAISTLLVVSTLAFSPATVPQAARANVALSMKSEEPVSKRQRALKVSIQQKSSCLTYYS